MGTWGYKPEQNDTYCEIVELFQKELRFGKDPQEIDFHIRSGYETNSDYCIVKLAIMDCLWQLGLPVKNYLHELEQMIQKKEFERYLYDMDAEAEYIRRFIRHVKKRLVLYEQPVRNTNIIDSHDIDNSNITKGACFWYYFKRKKYGAVILEEQEENWLIAITEKLEIGLPTMQDIVGAPMYSLAWFCSTDILSPRRLHYLGKIDILRCFHNMYGLTICNGSYSLTNVGQQAIWEHRYWSIRLRDTTIKEIIGRGDGL